MNYKDWFDAHYHELTGNGLWLRSLGLNIEETNSTSYQVLWARLSSAFDTQESFTHSLLYQIAAKTPGICSDVSFLPSAHDRLIFDKHKVPWLLGVESKSGPQDFNLVGLSASIVQEVINIPTVLKQSGIPIAKTARINDLSIPLIILGGSSAIFSAAAWMNSDTAWVDGIFSGHEPEVIRRILEICRDGKNNLLSKTQVLEKLSHEVPGFFLPGAQNVKPLKNDSKLSTAGTPSAVPTGVLPGSLASGTVVISDGCPFSCRFCAESWCRKPYREMSKEEILRAALEAKANQALENIDLFSFNFNAHSALYEILPSLAAIFQNIGLKSQRIDIVADSPGLLETEMALGKSSFTFGIEGISQRIRNYLNKGITTEQIRIALSSALKLKAREVKLFFIITGLETDEDFAEFSELLREIQSVGQSVRKFNRVICSFTPLVRFPCTPLQYEDAPDEDVLRPLLFKAQKIVTALRFESRAAASLSDYLISQVLVRARSVEVSEALLVAIEKTGFVYYRTMEEAFKRAFVTEFKNRGFELKNALKGLGSREVQVSEAFKENKTRIKRTLAKPPLQKIRELVSVGQKDCKSIAFLIVLHDSSRGLPRKLMGLSVARAIMLTVPELTPHYKRFIGSYWDESESPNWITGKDEVKLGFSTEGSRLLLKSFGDPAFLIKINKRLEPFSRLIGLSNGEWRPEELIIKSGFKFDPSHFTKKKGLKHTLRKRDFGAYELEFAKEAKKKQLIDALSYQKHESFWQIRLIPGIKFMRSELEAFLQVSFLLERPEQWVRIEVQAK